MAERVTDMATKVKDLMNENRRLLSDRDRARSIKRDVNLRAEMAQHFREENRRLEDINAMFKDTLVMIAMGEVDAVQSARVALQIGEWMRE